MGLTAQSHYPVGIGSRRLQPIHYTFLASSKLQTRSLHHKSLIELSQSIPTQSLDSITVRESQTFADLSSDHHGFLDHYLFSLKVTRRIFCFSSYASATRRHIMAHDSFPTHLFGSNLVSTSVPHVFAHASPSLLATFTTTATWRQYGSRVLFGAPSWIKHHKHYVCTNSRSHIFHFLR